MNTFSDLIHGGFRGNPILHRFIVVFLRIKRLHLKRINDPLPTHGTLYHRKRSPQLMASSCVSNVYSATASFQFPTIMFSCSHLSQTIHILCPGSRRTRTSFLRLRCRSAETIVLICRTAITFPHSAQRIGYRSSLTLSPPPTALSASRQVRIPPGQSRTSRMVLRFRP